MQYLCGVKGNAAMKKDTNKELVNDPIREARRYVDNAKEALDERGKLNYETRRYEDEKYVKAAGHYLWHSVLIALDAVFHVKKAKRNRKGDGSHVDIDDYIAAVSPRDKKLLAYVVTGYKILHVAMGYDGASSKATCDDGIRIANEVINRCETLMAS